MEIKLRWCIRLGVARQNLHNIYSRANAENDSTILAIKVFIFELFCNEQQINAHIYNYNKSQCITNVNLSITLLFITNIS